VLLVIRFVHFSEIVVSMFEDFETQPIPNSDSLGLFVRSCIPGSSLRTSVGCYSDRGAMVSSSGGLYAPLRLVRLRVGGALFARPGVREWRGTRLFRWPFRNGGACRNLSRDSTCRWITFIVSIGALGSTLAGFLGCLDGFRMSRFPRGANGAAASSFGLPWSARRCSCGVFGRYSMTMLARVRGSR